MESTSAFDEKTHEFIGMRREMIEESPYSFFMSTRELLGLNSTGELVHEISSHFPSTAKSFLLSR